MYDNCITIAESGGASMKKKRTALGLDEVESRAYYFCVGWMHSAGLAASVVVDLLTGLRRPGAVAAGLALRLPGARRIEAATDGAVARTVEARFAAGA